MTIRFRRTLLTLLAASFSAAARAVEIGPAADAPALPAIRTPLVQFGGMMNVLPGGAATLSVAPSLSAPALSLSAPAAHAAPAAAAVAAPEAAKLAALAERAQAAVAAASAALPATPASAAAPAAIPAASAPRPTAAAMLAAARTVLAGVSAEDLRTMPEERLQVFSASLLEDMGRRAEMSAAPAAEDFGALPAAGAALEAATPRAAPPSRGVPPAAGAARARRLVWPALVALVWTSWTTLMTAGHHWGLFAHDWFMTVTMALGSFVAGASSEGSASISFPVMTLLFHIPPPVARDFSLMIQSVGMTVAGLTILATRIPIEKRAILWGALGGLAGMALGATFVAPLFVPAFAKMFFTSLWASFALSHWLMNRRSGRVVHDRIQNFGPKDAAALALFGVLGGMVSSIVGTGLCMVIFTLLTLGYRVSEKVATPTSVILMATNALFGFFWKTAVLGGMAAAAWSYWWVSVPIVVIGAPLGARFISGRSRHFVAGLLYTAIVAQLIVALLIVHQTPLLLAASAATFVAGLLVFRGMARRGAAKEKAAESAI